MIYQIMQYNSSYAYYKYPKNTFKMGMPLPICEYHRSWDMEDKTDNLVQDELLFS